MRRLAMTTDDQDRLKKRPVKMLGLGIAIGAGVGVALENIPMGVALGVAIGAGLEAKRRRAQKQDSSESSGVSPEAPSLETQKEGE